MPVFLNPQFLWLGFLAMVIPILIHLFSRHRSRLVKFSLLGLIQPANVQPMTQLRLIEPLLLILRLGLLLLASLLLAELVWPTKSDSSKPLVIVTQDWLNHASATQKQALADRMGKSNVICLDPAAPFHSRTLNAEQLLNNPDTVALQNTGDNLWLSLFNLTRNMVRQREITVYTTDRLEQFSGQLFSIQQPLNWQILPVALPPLPNMTLRVLVLYAPQQQTSMRYLRGALEALNHQAGLTVDIVYRQQGRMPIDNQLLINHDWVLYLSAEPLNKLLLDYVHQGGKLLLTAAQVDKTGSWSAHKPQSDARISIHQLGNPALPHSITAELPRERLWQTADGQDLLNQYIVGQGQMLVWHSRFTPKWNSLVNQLDFPIILNALLIHDKAAQRALTSGRLSPELIRSSQTKIGQVTTARLNTIQMSEMHSGWFQLLLVLLVISFCTERLVAEYCAVRPVNQPRGNVK